MAKYSNRIKRKRFIKKATHKFVKLINITSNQTEQSVPLYKYIWNDIKNGLDYVGEIRYNLYYANDHMPSLEGIYTEYFNQTATDRELQNMFKALKEFLPDYIQRKYKDLDFIYGEDNKGLYIAINYGSSN